MEKRTFRLGCLITGLLVLILLVAGGGWWFFRLQPSQIESPPTSPINVFLISPSSGDELKAGDFASVSVQAFAPDAIQSIELFVDGVSLGAVSDSLQSVSWTWQAWPVGIHTLVAHATSADGQVGQSQTIIVSVLAGDGIMEVAAQGGQTLEQIGSKFGVLPDQMANANPKKDPTQPLKDGQPVKVPVGGAGADNGSGGGSGQTPPGESDIPDNVSIPVLINWQFLPTEPVDKSYCYTSEGNDNWVKIPKNPFEFFNGQVNYPQYNFNPSGDELVIQVQCWGWLGDALKFLGEGDTNLNLGKAPEQVTVTGAGFQLVGMPKFKTEPEKMMGGGGYLVAPPFALREPEDAADCASHGNPILSGFVCNTLLNAPVQEYIILEWEWQPHTCWPGQDCNWLNDIDGYSIYEVDPFSKFSKHMKDVSNPAQKVTALPLPWGFHCYTVEAFATHPENGSKVVSPKTIYCPDDSPKPKKTTLVPPNSWVTTGGQWIEVGCGAYGEADYYLLENKNTGFGNQPGEILAGSYLVDDVGCYAEGQYSAGVKFNIQPSLLPGAVIQKAVLRFSKDFIYYKAPGVAGPAPYACISTVGKAKQDWSGLSNGNHFSSQFLATPSNNAPITSVDYAQSQADVTVAVIDWFKHPENNHGFILTPASAPNPMQLGTSECLSGLGGFELDIYYFAP